MFAITGPWLGDRKHTNHIQRQIMGDSFCLIVCLYRIIRLTRDFFTHMETSPLPVKVTYTRHTWPLSSEGSLACHTYGYTGHPFIMVIFDLLPSVWQWSYHYLFLKSIITPSFSLHNFSLAFCILKVLISFQRYRVIIL